MDLVHTPTGYGQARTFKLHLPWEACRDGVTAMTCDCLPWRKPRISLQPLMEQAAVRVGSAGRAVRTGLPRPRTSSAAAAGHMPTLYMHLQAPPLDAAVALPP
jgi:hypothetical protein